MDSPADIQLTGRGHHAHPPSFAGGVLHATNTTGDPNVTFLNHVNNGVPIDTSRYRFLSYVLQVDGPYDLANGSVARVFWSSAQFLNGNTATTTKDIIVWPGMNSYTIDLASLSTAPDGGLEPAGVPEAWTSGAKRHLRFDPHEFAQARTFHIDAIKLAVAETVNSRVHDPVG